MINRNKEKICSYTTKMSLLILLFCILLHIAQFSIVERCDLQLRDLLFWLRGKVEPQKEIAIVAIDEASLAQFGRWPWSRQKIARAITVLSACKAKVIVLDIAFLERSSEKDDNVFAETLAKCTIPVILSYFARFEEDANIRRATPLALKYLAKSSLKQIEHIGDKECPPLLTAHQVQLPLEKFCAHSDLGNVSTITDIDGVQRRYPLVITFEGSHYSSLALRALWHYLSKPAQLLRTDEGGAVALELDSLTIPCDEKGQLFLNYLGPPKTFSYISMIDLLSPNPPREDLRDKIVLVGATALGARDYTNTPFSAFHPAVEVHATCIDNTLTDRLLHKGHLHKLYDLVLLIGFGIALCLLLRRSNLWLGLCWAFFLAFGHFGLTYVLFTRASILLSQSHVFLSIFLVFSGTSLLRYYLETRDRRAIEGAFGHYVSPVVINQMLENPERLKLGGEERVISVLFSDLAGFTKTSEKLGPSEMVGLMSEYFERMTEEIYEEGGMLKEYVGDELMALFGAPLEQEDHAVRACRAALRMQGALNLLRKEWVKKELPPLTSRTGINTGPMLVGNLGSTYRFSYGALGDNVNLGSRLEGINKIYGTDIIIGEATAEKVKDSFHLRELDTVRVVGKEKAIVIFELIAEVENTLSEKTVTKLKSYSEALSFYRKGDLPAAEKKFDDALLLDPKDGPSKTMKKRCGELKELGLPSEWNGIYEAQSK